MRKGELKRQEMLAAAEKLFLARGYDATSVQDILDLLHASKGGFYHHFASKEEVLKILCAQRAERAAERTAVLLESEGGDMARINAVLYGFMPLQKEEAPFLRMLLPQIERSEGRVMGMIYQDALADHFQPLLSREIAAAAAQGAVCPPVRGMEDVILHLLNCCWLTAAAEISRAISEGRTLDGMLLLTTLEKYRRSIEVLLDAPYGSVEILRYDELASTAEAVSR